MSRILNPLQALLGLACLVSFTGLCQSQPPKRIALVIGAQNYSDLPPLRNSLSDARAISATLQKKGFVVQSLYDPKTKREIKDGINWYFTQMRDQNGAVGLIYYAGHGMQYQGENFIIPTSATLQNPGDLEDYCVKMNTVIAILNSATTSLNILLLDACRSLPSFTRGVEQGLTKMDAPEGAIIVFATQPGKVASDGSGSNGLFTSKLLGAINEPGLNINDVFQKVKREVYAESKKEQLPSVEDNAIGGYFYFTPGDRPVTKNSETPAMPVPVKEEKKPEPPVLVSGIDFGYGSGKTKVVMIGDLKWVTQNLNLNHFRNGDLIPEAKTKEDWVKAGKEKKPVWGYPRGEAFYESTFGRFYNYYAATDPRGVCPVGWHVSTEEEWINLIDYVGESAPSKLKSTSKWENNGNGDDTFGFNGLPAGSTYHSMELSGAWFSLSPDSRIGVRGMNYVGDKVWKFAQYEYMGYPIRCVSDDTKPRAKKAVGKTNFKTFTIVAEAVPNLDFGYGGGETESVVINKQKWISKNLNVDHFANSEPIQEVKTKEEWIAAIAKKQPAWCYYGDDPVNGPQFGRLYNFYAVNDPRGVCPAGWTIPANQDWADMIAYIGSQEAGVQLKADNSWKFEGNGIDGLGFSGLSGGIRLDDGKFYGFGDIGYFWSSTAIEGAASMYSRQLISDKNYVVINSAGKGNGLSVRCIKK